MDRFFGGRQRQTGHLLVAIGVGLFLGSGAAGWARPPAGGDAAPAETFGVRGPSVEKVLKPVRLTPSEELGIDFAIVPEVRLKAVDADALLREDEQTERGARTKVVRFGIGRDLQVAARDGFWYDLPNGKRLWVGEVVSSDAIGVRLHFKDVRLPAGAELAVYLPSRSDLTHGIVKSGSSRFDPDRYVEFYGAANPMVKRGDFWTGTIFGERARIEYLAPAGAPDELPFAVDRLQHVYRDPVAQLAKGLMKAPAGACENDVTCSPEWGDLARAVSGVGFIGANSLFCTGQLLTSQSQDFTPYWLTANHCMSDPFEAEAAEFFWLYQTATCGGPPPSLNSVPRSQGATLVSTNTQSDYTLLLVNGAVPAGDLFWSGWTGKEPANGTDAVAIHHPSGDFKRISFGFKDAAVAECFTFPGFGGRKLVRTNWTNAVTEPGSSGSGIFRADTGQLYGQLLGGPSACGVAPADLFDCYGSFATTYTKIKTPLKTGSDDKSEQNDSCAKARVVKTGTLGGRIVKIFDEDWYKISVKPGQTITAELGFANANGDIDFEFYGACNGQALEASTSTTDGEILSLTNVGSKAAFAFFRVFLANDTRNNYDINFRFE